jgi:hypothetical protein
VSENFFERITVKKNQMIIDRLEEEIPDTVKTKNGNPF